MPILIGSGLIASAGLLSLLTHYGLADFSQQFVIAFGRFTVMGEAIAFLAALAVVIARARRKQTERDAQVIELLQAQLKLTEDLRQTDASYLNAMRLAQSRQDAIAFATHDMRQPLAALQVALDRAPSLSPDDRRSLEDLRAYLERIVEQFLNRSHEERSGGKSAAISPGAPEEVPVSIVLDAVSAMFAEDARAGGILLKTAQSQLTAYADPMVLVRLLFEFCLERDPAFGDRKGVGWMSRAWDRVAFFVMDRGMGMTPEALRRAQERNGRRPESDGHGLGLSIAQQLADQNDIELVIESVQSQGTCASFQVARSAAQ